MGGEEIDGIEIVGFVGIDSLYEVEYVCKEVDSFLVFGF